MFQERFSEAARRAVQFRVREGPESVPERTNPAVIAEFGRTRSLGVFPHTKIGCATGCLGKAFLKHIDLKKIL
jgi:hypothetical protein